MKIEVYAPAIRRREMDAVLTALVEDQVGPGEHGKSLVQSAREYLGFDYCLALRSPVLALSFALRALGLEKGRGVLISFLSPRYYEEVIRDLGLEPVYCDVLSRAPVMGVETLEKVLKEMRKKPDGTVPGCIVLHHTLGFLPDSRGILELGLPLIEDCSHSFGAFLLSRKEEAASDQEGEKKKGNREQRDIQKKETEKSEASRPLSGGIYTILGLEDRDMLTAGGGALLYTASRKDSGPLRAYGSRAPEYALPDMNAALAVVQFREAVKNLKKRELIARAYAQAALERGCRVFDRGEEGAYNNYAFPLVLESGVKDLKVYAKKKDIAVESAFERTCAGSGEIRLDQCPEACSLALRTVLFPLHPRLGEAEVERVARLIRTMP
jgi:dTDP-4-amino-4,6-dideoxygalactose transaminase